VKDVLANRDLEGLAEPAALLTSELVANAVLFARSDVVVELLFPSPCVRFEVRAREPGASRAHGARPNEACRAAPWTWSRPWLTTGARSLTARESPSGSSCESGEATARRSSAESCSSTVRPPPTVRSTTTSINFCARWRWLAPGEGRKPAANDRVHRVMSTIVDSHRDARGSAWAQAQREVTAPSISLWFPHSAADASRELLELLQEATAYARRGAAHVQGAVVTACVSVAISSPVLVRPAHVCASRRKDVGEGAGEACNLMPGARRLLPPETTPRERVPGFLMQPLALPFANILS
jgi:hypothetical protein